MLHPDHDIEGRAPVWDSLQMLYMDTDVTLSYTHIIETCGSSKYSIDELEDILYNEVLPAVRFNMLSGTTPEWRGFTLESLTKRVLKKHRFGKRRPWVRVGTDEHWPTLRTKIVEYRTRI
jgi:hypothetical protein